MTTKIKSKGTALQMTVAAAYVTIGQVISLDGPSMESETYESDTLDNASAGIPYSETGRTEGGSVSGELFFDPVDTYHLAMLALLTTPASMAYNMLFADAATTDWAFTGVGLQFGPKVALADGLKASFSVKLSGIPTF